MRYIMGKMNITITTNCQSVWLPLNAEHWALFAGCGGGGEVLPLCSWYILS